MAWTKDERKDENPGADLALHSVRLFGILCNVLRVRFSTTIGGPYGATDIVAESIG